MYQDEAISAERDLTIEVVRRLQTAWSCVGRCRIEPYDLRSVRVRLKAQIPKAEVIETLISRLYHMEPEHG